LKTHRKKQGASVRPSFPLIDFTPGLEEPEVEFRRPREKPAQKLITSFQKHNPGREGRWTFGCKRFRPARLVPTIFRSFLRFSPKKPYVYGLKLVSRGGTGDDPSSATGGRRQGLAERRGVSCCFTRAAKVAEKAADLPRTFGRSLRTGTNPVGWPGGGRPTGQSETGADDWRPAESGPQARKSGAGKCRSLAVRNLRGHVSNHDRPVQNRTGQCSGRPPPPPARGEPQPLPKRPCFDPRNSSRSGHSKTFRGRARLRTGICGPARGKASGLKEIAKFFVFFAPNAKSRVASRPGQFGRSRARTENVMSSWGKSNGIHQSPKTRRFDTGMWPRVFNFFNKASQAMHQPFFAGRKRYFVRAEVCLTVRTKLAVLPLARTKNRSWPGGPINWVGRRLAENQNHEMK